MNKQNDWFFDYYIKFKKMLFLYKEKVAFFITFIIGVISIVGGFKYGIGTLTNLDRGAFPVFTGLIISLLSISLFFSASLEKTEAEDENNISNGGKRIFILLLVLALYILLLNKIGFLICSFLFLLLLQKLMGQTGWKTPFIISIITVMIFWILFKKWLNVQLPVGLIKF